MSGSHSLPLVVVSILIAVVASYTALDLASSLMVAQGRARAAWLAGGSLAMGAGIWSMHFVGMLAFRMPGMAIAYDVPLLFLSVAVAVAASALALAVVCRPTVSTAAMVAASLAMGAAIAGMHYTAMAAARFLPAPGPTTIQPGDVLATSGLAVAVSGTTLLILAVAVAGSVVDRELSRRGALARENARLLRETQLQEQAVELEQQVEQARSMAVHLEETNEELRVSTELLREKEERFRQLAETIDEVFHVPRSTRSAWSTWGRRSSGCGGDAWRRSGRTRGRSPAPCTRTTGSARWRRWRGSWAAKPRRRSTASSVPTARCGGSTTGRIPCATIWAASSALWGARPT